jgi:hypothetical protein
VEKISSLEAICNMLPKVQGEGMGVKRCGGVGGGDVCVSDSRRGGGRHGWRKGKQAAEREKGGFLYVYKSVYIIREKCE